MQGKKWPKSSRIFQINCSSRSNLCFKLARASRGTLQPLTPRKYFPFSGRESKDFGQFAAASKQTSAEESWVWRPLQDRLDAFGSIKKTDQHKESEEDQEKLKKKKKHPQQTQFVDWKKTFGHHSFSFYRWVRLPDCCLRFPQHSSPSSVSSFFCCYVVSWLSFPFFMFSPEACDCRIKLNELN